MGEKEDLSEGKWNFKVCLFQPKYHLVTLKAFSLVGFVCEAILSGRRDCRNNRYIGLGPWLKFVLVFVHLSGSPAEKYVPSTTCPLGTKNIP